MARSLGAKGTRNYQHRSGSNTSVRSNQMSRHTTPARSQAAAVSTRTGTFNAGMGQNVGGVKHFNSATGKTVARSSIRVYGTGSSRFRAPSSMPGRLNNTAAAAVSSRRFATSSAAATAIYAPVGAIGFAARSGQNKGNNFAQLRLRAAGYKVGGTGFKGVIKPASARTQARAKARLAKKDAKFSVNQVKGGVKTNYGTQRGVTVSKLTRQGKKAKGGGRRNFRPRRDSRGRWAGSY